MQQSQLKNHFKTFFFIQDNYTALHLAVEAGKSADVEALLGHGAQVSWGISRTRSPSKLKHFWDKESRLFETVQGEGAKVS